jgi:glycosyltransferase involved in cell wall biosynthesis
MKILRVHPFFQTDLLYLEHNVSRELKSYECETVFLSSNKINKSWKNLEIDKTQFTIKSKKYNDFSVIRTPSILLFDKPIPINPISIYKFLSKNQFDIIHFSGVSGFFNHIVLAIYLIIGGKGKIFINDHTNPNYVSNNMVARIYYWINKIIFKILFLNKISKVFTVNQGSYKLLKELYDIDENKLHIIPLGYNSEIYKFIDNNKRILNKEFIIGFAGKVEPRKKLENILSCLVSLNLSNYKFFIVGADNNNSYTQKLLQFTIKNNLNVEFKPFIYNPTELALFYNHINLAVFPGSISITTIEANACGAPVIIYRSMEGLEDRVENDRGALFKNEKELRELILYFYQNEINHKKIAEETKRYNWQSISKIYYNYYKSTN